MRCLGELARNEGTGWAGGMESTVTMQVQFGENAGMAKWLERRVNHRKCVFILNSDLVQPTVIDAGSQCAICLSQEEESCSAGGQGKANETRGLGAVNILLHCLLLGA